MPPKLKCAEIVGDRGTYMEIPVGDLKIDLSYQRPKLTMASVNKIASEWVTSLCQALLVSGRSDGTYYVVDGQHRLAAARKRGDIRTLRCLVYRFDDVAHEARVFLLGNTQTVRVRAQDLHRARVTGQDSTAIWIDNLLSELGLHVDDRNCTPRNLRAIATFTSLAQIDRVKAESVMRAAVMIAGQDCIENWLLQGLFYFAVDHDLTPQRVSKLTRIGLADIKREWNADRVAYGGKERTSGLTILNAVNRGVRSKKLVYSDRSGRGENSK